MNTDIVIIDSVQNLTTAGAVLPDRLAGVMVAWLAEQSSKRTKETYGPMMADFRAYIQERGYDVDSKPADIAYMAQAFAALPHKKTGAPVTKSTHNLRLSAISSFFAYAINHDELSSPNPLDRVKRHKRDDYQGAKPLAFKDGEIQTALDAIPTDSNNGLRDKALLLLTLYTGRRLSEIASLACGDISYTSSSLVIEWQHMKGDKSGRNIIPSSSPAYAALLKWLRAFYGRGTWPSDGLVFVSLSRNSYGHRMTPQGIEQRAARWLPIGKAGQKGGKFHALRHTFAATMLDAGATVQELSEALGHSSLAVTSKYVHKMNSGDNAYITALEDVYAGRRRQPKSIAALRSAQEATL